jgi:hypothetical protein
VISEKVKSASGYLCGLFLEDHHDIAKTFCPYPGFVLRFTLDFGGLSAAKRQCEHDGDQ